MPRTHTQSSKTDTEKTSGSKNASSVSSKVAGTPLRDEGRRYYEGQQGMPADDILTHGTFKTENDFVDDLDDEEQISAALVEAGVDRAVDDLADEDEDNDEIGLDREFSLAKQATESLDDEDEDEEEEDDEEFELEADDDLDDLPHREPLKADNEI